MVSAARPANAADWPCFRGSNRDGITTESVGKWPPTQVWSTFVGEGYSEVVVSGGMVYTTGWSNDQDTVYCFEELSPGPSPILVWKSSYACAQSPNPSGTRATPTVDGNQVYTLSWDGRLICFNALTGSTNWIANVNVGQPGWGFASSPLVEGNSVIVNAGASGIAINKANGQTNWSSAGTAAYASPFAVTIGTQRTVVVYGGVKVSGVDPANGNTLWFYPRPSAGLVDPIVFNNKVWVSFSDSSSTMGSVLVNIAGSGQLNSTVWTNTDVCNESNPWLYYNGYLYGIGGGGLMCINASTGAKVWDSSAVLKPYDSASGLILANDKLVAVNDEWDPTYTYMMGDLVVVPATPTGYSETYRMNGIITPLNNDYCWTAPTLANGKLYMRTYQGTLVSFDVSAPPPPGSNTLVVTSAHGGAVPPVGTNVFIGGTGTNDVSISQGSDDARETVSNGVGKLTSSSLDIVDHPTAGNQEVGFRFNGLTIPKGATITSAYIQLACFSNTAGAASFTIKGEANDNAPTFTGVTSNIADLVRTSASVSWSPADWTVAGEAGAAERTTDLSAILQELVNRSGWTSGNSAAFIISGSGHRVAYTYESGDMAKVALLHVVWTSSTTLLNCYVTNSPVVNGTTQYVCAGWVGTGSVPASGATANTGPFTLATNSTITWLWTTNAASAPVITSSLSAGGAVNQPFSYQIVATGSPTNYSVTGTLPAGLSFAGNTISGTPTAAVTNSVTISAMSAAGTGTATLVISISASAPGPSGLVGWWKLDESAGLTAADSSGNGNNGTLTAGTWQPAGGKIAGALHLNAFDVVNCGAAASLNTPSVTVAFWMKPDSLGNVIPVDKLPTTGSVGYAVKLRDTGTIWFRVGAEGGPALDVYGGSNIYTNGVWTHVACSFDAATGNMRMYINGIVEGHQPTYSVTLNASNTTFRMGSTVEQYAGLLDDVRIYDHALTSNDVVTVMNGGGSSVQAPIISSIHSVGNSPQLSWSSAVGTTYAVYKSTNLLAGWIAQALTNIPGDGSAKIFTDPSPVQPAAFYRVTAR
jgi:hypothetical protein